MPHSSSPQKASAEGRGYPCPAGQRGKRPSHALPSHQADPICVACAGSRGSRKGNVRGRNGPEPPGLSPGWSTGAAAEPLSPPALGVSFILGPAGLTVFSGTRTAVVNEIRSPQITELCRTL